jgi:hypothetical protein
MLPWLLMGLSLVMTWVVFYYAYKLQLKMPSKINGAIGLIIIMVIFGFLIPWIALYILYGTGWKPQSTEWEIGIGLLLFLTWWLNAFYGAFLLIKFLLTHNKTQKPT